MKHYFLFITLTSLSIFTFSQKQSYWQQSVNYDIKVTLHDSLKTLDGELTLNYTNNSPDTLFYIWFHIWTNAYQNEKTAFSEQMLENGSTDFYFSTTEKKGYINQFNFRVNNIEATTEYHPVHQDIIKLILPSPLYPNASVIINTPFHVKLPYNFSRGGFVNNSFQITQWYPKPAVFDKYGWHEMPYLNQGEFYSEFGSYHVEINLPKVYKVASTGQLTNIKEENNIKTLHFFQDSVHDFAWFADKDYIIKHDTIQLQDRIIDIFAYHYPEKKGIWNKSCQYIKEAILTRSEWIGAYPFNIISVVESPQTKIGGMEYPTIALIEKSENPESLCELINHEVSHNWFYGMLGSNEREHPWIDEGINTYYDHRYKKWQEEKHQNKSKMKTSFLQNKMTDDDENLILQTLYNNNTDQPIETKANEFTAVNYALIGYYKASKWMKLLEITLGKDALDSIIHAYFKEWKCKHPYPEDFESIIKKMSSKNLDATFSLLHKKGDFFDTKQKKIKFSFIFNLKQTEKYHYIYFNPIAGFNNYDKLMLGGFIHNYSLPLSKFKFILAPLYTTGSDNLKGLGRISYSIFPGKKDNKIEISLSGSSFTNQSINDFSNDSKLLYFNKLSTEIKYFFPKTNPRSSMVKYVQYKTYFIKENAILYSRNPFNQTDIISFPQNSTTIHQLKLSVNNSRILYPYTATINAEAGKQFIKIGCTGNYYFNYANGGGMECRLFAGKFLYTVTKTFLTQYQTERFQLNLSGANGHEDYTYNNYFVGRNESAGILSQQLMIKEGGFKIKTDLLSNKIGKSDNWLAAINMSTTLPQQFNALHLLPLKIPFYLFADLGTFSDALKSNNENEKIYYDAGIQISLAKKIINMYIPVLYSRSFRDYIKSTIFDKKLLKTISFSIDIQNITLKRFIPQSPI